MYSRWVLMMGFIIMACQSPPPEPVSLPDEDRTAVSAMHDAFRDALIAGDFATLAGMYTENGVLMPPNGPAVEGRANIQTWGEAFPKVTEATITPVEIDGRGDLAFVRGTFSLTFAPEAEGAEPAQDQGKFVDILRKQADGAWLIAVDIFNSDLPAQTSSGE